MSDLTERRTRAVSRRVSLALLAHGPGSGSMYAAQAAALASLPAEAFADPDVTADPAAGDVIVGDMRIPIDLDLSGAPMLRAAADYLRDRYGLTPDEADTVIARVRESWDLKAWEAVRRPVVEAEVAAHATAMEYVHATGRLIDGAEDSWAWPGTPDLPDDVIRSSAAATALDVWLGQTTRGAQGVIPMADGRALSWHEDHGWTVWGADGTPESAHIPWEATPERVAAAYQPL